MQAIDYLRELRQILGEEGLRTEPDDRRRYEEPARYQAGHTPAVLLPATTQQVSSVVSYCVLNELPLLPQGANTGLVLGSTPDDSGRQFELSLERLTGGIESNRQDRTVTARGGTRLSSLNDALFQIGLHLPIDLGADPSIGGMVATNTGGARYLRYGDMRDHVLAVEAVLLDAQGSIVRLGRGLRKDNSTLDLLDLFVGSGGALGIVTEAKILVDVKPSQREAFLLTFDDERPAWISCAHSSTPPANC